MLIMIEKLGLRCWLCYACGELSHCYEVEKLLCQLSRVMLSDVFGALNMYD